MQDRTKKQKTVNPIATGIAGVVIGAAAGAAAVALSDKETREKATKKAKQMKDDLHKWSNKTIQDIQQRSETVRTDSKEMLEKQKENVSKEVKNKLDEMDETK